MGLLCRLAVVCVLLVVWVRECHADNRAVDFLGWCNPTWECDDSLEVFRDEHILRAGWLAHTFGRRCPCAAKFLSDPRPKVFRVHLINSTCFPERGRVCGRYELYAGLTVKRAQRLIIRRNEKLLRRFDRIARPTQRLVAKAQQPFACLISPELESSLSRRARRVLLKRAARLFRACTIVDNPVRGACVAGYLCERHGAHVRADIVSLDGVDPSTIDVEAWFARASSSVLAFYWDFQKNCLFSTSFIDPRSRSCGTTRSYFADVRSVLRGGGSL